MRVILIVGAGRSGSTLLTRLAGQAPDAFAAGELRHLLASGAISGDQSALCTCGATFASCPHWKRVADGLQARGWDPRKLDRLSRNIDRIRYIPRILWPRLRGTESQERVAEYTGYLGDLYTLIAEVSRANVVVDSSKDPSHLFLLAQVPELELDIVHLIRDPRAVAYSWTTKKPLRETAEGRVYMRRYGVTRSAAFWTVTNLLAEFGGRLGQSYRRLRYEDFVADPEGAIRVVVGDGVPTSSFLNGTVATFPSPEHIVRGNPDRFENDEIEVRLDSRWQIALPIAKKRLVSTVCAPLLVRYGYRLSRSSERH